MAKKDNNSKIIHGNTVKLILGNNSYVEFYDLKHTLFATMKKVTYPSGDQAVIEVNPSICPSLVQQEQNTDEEKVKILTQLICNSHDMLIGRIYKEPFVEYNRYSTKTEELMRQASRLATKSYINQHMFDTYEHHGRPMTEKHREQEKRSFSWFGTGA